MLMTGLSKKKKKLKNTLAGNNSSYRKLEVSPRLNSRLPCIQGVFGIRTAIYTTSQERKYLRQPAEFYAFFRHVASDIAHRCNQIQQTGCSPLRVLQATQTELIATIRYCEKKEHDWNDCQELFVQRVLQPNTT